MKGQFETISEAADDRIACYARRHPQDPQKWKRWGELRLCEELAEELVDAYAYCRELIGHGWVCWSVLDGVRLLWEDVQAMKEALKEEGSTDAHEE